jgi:hypothetical protein
MVEELQSRFNPSRTVPTDNLILAKSNQEVSRSLCWFESPEIGKLKNIQNKK